MPLIRLANDKTFHASSDISILDAAAGAGLVLPHSCRTGRCGTCRARVTRGQVAARDPSVALKQEEVNAGWALTCVARAMDDVSLDIDDVGLPLGLTPKTFPCRIHSIDRPASDVAIIRLRLPPTATLHWLAGQYIDIIGPAFVRRSYSIATDPGSSGGLIELHIRRVPDGLLSDYWFRTAKIDDLLRLHGPLGTFFLRDTSGLDVVMLATGTGIAPINALLAELSTRPDAQQPRSVSLLWGNRKESDLYCSPAPPARHADRFSFIPVLSRPAATWQGARGYVQDIFLSGAHQWANLAVYACGSPVMIENARRDLLDAGLSPRRFFSDAFVSSA